MRAVTGYYHMSAWRFRSKTHSLIVIAPNMDDAKETVRKFLRDHGWGGVSNIGIDQFHKIRNIPSNSTVIVADFHSA